MASVGDAADKATDAVGSVAGKATHAVGHAAGKAKIPLLAGGAALAAGAGGLALGARQGRHGNGIAKAIRRRPKVKLGPQVKIDSKGLASAAKEVGAFGAELGHLANELQRARESSNGGKHRSPVEVVLEGLTARRSRS